MLEIKTEKDGIMVKASGTTMDIFNELGNVVMSLYLHTCKNAKKAMPFMPMKAIVDMTKNQLIEIIDTAIVIADSKLKEIDKKDIQSADFNLDMDEKEFMKKLFGLDDEVSE